MRYPLVTNDIEFTRYTVSAPGTAQQFPNTAIKDGYKTVFKARFANSGNFYIADTAANAQSTTGNRKVLEAGESITIEIDNLNRLFRDADNSTDILEVTLTAPSN